MALVKIKKIQLIAATPHKEKILSLLQETGEIEVRQQTQEEAVKKTQTKLQKAELKLANTEFAIRLLSPFAASKGLFAAQTSLTSKEVEAKFKHIKHEEIAKQCLEIEDQLTQAKNAISSNENEAHLFEPWKNLQIKLSHLQGTKTTKLLLGSIKSSIFPQVSEALHSLSECVSSETVSKTTSDVYFYIIFSTELEKEVRQVLNEFKFQEAELKSEHETVKDHLKALTENSNKHKETINKSQSKLKDLAENTENLKIAHDYLAWEMEKLQTEEKLTDTNYTFTVNAWIPAPSLAKVEEEISQITNEYEISERTLEEDEIPPVIIKNNKFLRPFEAVSSIYGLPKYSELDPTPFLAAYFIVFFALCLTDAGYGLVMFIGMWAVGKFVNLQPGIAKMVKLLMYGGLITFIIGTLFGGWFGLTPDQVPAFLTYISPSGEKFFVFQKINALSDPITVLIISLALGYTQVLMGVIMKFVHDFGTGNKKEAILDAGTWVFMLTGIGLFIVGSAVGIPMLALIGKWWTIAGAAILILTQGREKSSIFGKAISGVLSLYGLVGYMSDILSYSRLLALGLATAIIGLAVNIVATLVRDMIPYAGYILMVVVFIGGHIFNLLINALGAFIHSGRLQFVEFFTKFMEGGGDDFKPFSKKCKYIFLKPNN